MKVNSFIKFLFIALITYTFIALFIGFLDIRESLKLLPFSLFISSLFIPISVHLLLSARWYYFLRFLDLPIGYLQSSKVYFSALALIGAPARSGEAIRGVWLYNKFNFPVNLGVSVTIVERFGELISALLILAISVEYPYNISIYYLLIFILVLLTLISSKKLFNFLNKISFCSTFINSKFSKGPIIKQFYNIIINSRLLIKPFPFLISLLVCILVWFLESNLLFVVFQKLEVNITLQQSIVIRTLMGIGGVISFLPAGLLVSESTGIALAIAYGASRPEAFAATFFIRLYTLYIPFLIGLIFYSSERTLNEFNLQNNCRFIIDSKK